MKPLYDMCLGCGAGRSIQRPGYQFKKNRGYYPPGSASNDSYDPLDEPNKSLENPITIRVAHQIDVDTWSRNGSNEVIPMDSVYVQWQGAEFSRRTVQDKNLSSIEHHGASGDALV